MRDVFPRIKDGEVVPNGFSWLLAVDEYMFRLSLALKILNSMVRLQIIRQRKKFGPPEL